MNPQTFIEQLEKFVLELESDVISYYEENNRERGWVAFTNWRNRVIKFLNKYTENEGSRLLSYTTVHFAVANNRESSYQSFMRSYGEKSLAFIDELISETKKGNLIILEDRVEEKKKEANPVESNQSDDWLKKFAWIMGVIVAFLVFVLSAMWFVRDRDFEPAITTIGSLIAFATLITKKDIKGVIFVVGFVIGILLTTLLFYLFPQRVPEKSSTQGINTENNTNVVQQINSGLKNSNSTPASTPASLQPSDTELRKTAKNLTITVQETRIRDGRFFITLLLVANNIDMRVMSDNALVRINAQSADYRYPMFLAKGEMAYSDLDKNLVADKPLEIQCIFDKIPINIENIEFFEIIVKTDSGGEKFQFKDLKANMNYR